MKVYIKNQQKSLRVNERKIAGLLRKALHALGLHRAELSVLFVNDRRMKILNLQYRGIDKTTDVLSFPLLSAKEQKLRRAEASLNRSRSGTSELETPDRSLPLGDIVVNLHKAKRQSAENGISFNEEINRLLIHGLLHLVGYDHEQSPYLKSKMEKKEMELLRSAE